MLIGTASQIITPELGCPLAGFDARKGVAESVHDDLFARALVFDDGQTSLALVSIDVLGLSGAFADHVRAEVKRSTGIPRAHVILCATHTHCAPVTLNHFFNQGQALDEAYLDRLARAIVSGTVRAFEDRRERRIRSGFVRVDGVAVNRRTQDGLPIDPIAGVLTVEEPGGKVAATSVFYPCHPTTLGPDTLAITADFPYYTGTQLKNRLGEDVEVLYFNGAEGDLSVGHRSDLSAIGVIAPNRTFRRAEELGARLADSVLCGELALESGSLRTASTVARLPLKSYAPVEEMRARREQAGMVMMQAIENNAAPEEVNRAKQASLFARIEEYYAELANAPVLEAELTAFSIGDTAFVSFPGEVFVQIALDIRKRSPFAKTMFLGLANDYIGYVPTAEANTALGYEVVASRVRPEAARELTDTAVQLLTALAGQRSVPE